MIKQFLFIALAMFCTTGAFAQKSTVWTSPAIDSGNALGDGFFNTCLDVTKVELQETETLVHLTVKTRTNEIPGYDLSFSFAADTYLQADGQRYPLLSADGLTPGESTTTNAHNELDIVFHFQPLPLGTKSFDFIEGDGQNAWQIRGVKPVEECRNRLLPSYWRDDKTGDWVIAFTEDCAIYQCKFWDYKQREVDDKSGKAEMVLTNGDEELKVSVGKDKKGRRTMRIGDKKATLSMITGRFLSEYPVKDRREGFVDNGYKMDTVTVIGWLKDMPSYYKDRKTFRFANKNIFTGSQTDHVADLDSLGRFTIKIPIINSSEFFCDWGRCFVRTMFEPGKTYFMLYDFKEGRRFFMGDDVRLQNELFHYPADWNNIVIDMYMPDEKNRDFDKYTQAVDSLLQSQFAYIDQLCAAHPSLSARFKTFRKGNTLWQQAFDYVQSRFYVKGDHRLSPEALQYAHDTFWTRYTGPLPLHRETTGFIRDYINEVRAAHPFDVTWNIDDHVDECASNDEERELFTRLAAVNKETLSLIETCTTEEEKVKVVQEQNAKNKDLIDQVVKLLNTPQLLKRRNGQILIDKMKNLGHLLDSLQAPPIVKEAELTRLVYQELEYNRSSLIPEAIDTFKTLVSHPNGIELVEKENNRYIAIENRDIDRLVLKSSDPLKGISEGEALLQKILEPYKGKLVLLDVWGTWCGPCKEALSHSTEEYARLAKYDIVYLYLANNSPRNSWENVIKEYNVSGDNVAHYNLPYEQQNAIERYLEVQHYPTYKLFDREGHLLDLTIDARNLNDLERMVKRLSKQ